MNKLKEEITVSKLFWNGLFNRHALPIVVGATFVTTLYIYQGIKSNNFVVSAIGLVVYAGYILLFHYRNSKKEYQRIQEELEQERKKYY